MFALVVTAIRASERSIPSARNGPIFVWVWDGDRRYVDVNRPASLWFRVSVEEIRQYTMDDLAPADQLGVIERDWARMLDTGCIASHYLAARPDGSRVDTVFCAIAHVLPGLHVSVFAPVDWPEEELGAIEDDGSDPFASLTAREIEVLALAADGLSGAELAAQLVVSPATVHTHFENIYKKLQVRSRAVAKAMRLGMIE